MAWGEMSNGVGGGPITAKFSCLVSRAWHSWRELEGPYPAIVILVTAIRRHSISRVMGNVINYTEIIVAVTTKKNKNKRF